MPDPAKHAALERQGFKIAHTCGTCRLWTEGASPAWGKCALAIYEHGKHSGINRLAGTPAVGTCSAHEVSLTAQHRHAGEEYMLRYTEDRS